MNLKSFTEWKPHFVNDMVPALTGESRRSLDDEFICFDVETTGLSPNTDRFNGNCSREIKKR